MSFVSFTLPCELSSPKPDAKDIPKKDEERLLEEKMEAEERVNPQDDVRNADLTSDYAHFLLQIT